MMSKTKVKIDDIGDIESKDGSWEIFNNESLDIKSNKEFKLLYVHGETYSNNDITINLTKAELIDLIKLCKKIKI